MDERKERPGKLKKYHPSKFPDDEYVSESGCVPLLVVLIGIISLLGIISQIY